MKHLIPLLISLLLVGCTPATTLWHTGLVEARPVRISAESGGIVEKMLVDEGDVITKGVMIAVIESNKVLLKQQDIVAQLRGMDWNAKSVRSQMQQIAEQLKLQQKMLQKTTQLYKKGLSSAQSVDELTTQVQVLRSRANEAASRLAMLKTQKDQISSGQKLVNLQLAETRVVAPRPGTVLTRYIEAGETVAPGQPIIELADLRTLVVRTYVPLFVLSTIKIAQPVSIRVEGVDAVLPGIVLTVASQAEFTPKVVYSKETKQSLVYAVRIRVENLDGVLKVGMPVEVRF